MDGRAFLWIKSLVWMVFLAENVLYGATKKVTLKSAQHHVGSSVLSTRLELGTMILFFSDQVVPILLHKKNISDNRIEQRIVFPHVSLQNEQVKGMVDQINNQSSEAYNLKLIPMHTPVQGVELLITYNQNEVFYHYETTVSSSSLPGYVFRFINQTCYKDLTKKISQKGITHTVWQKKSRAL